MKEYITSITCECGFKGEAEIQFIPCGDGSWSRYVECPECRDDSNIEED